MHEERLKLEPHLTAACRDPGLGSSGSDLSKIPSTHESIDDDFIGRNMLPDCWKQDWELWQARLGYREILGKLRNRLMIFVFQDKEPTSCVR